MQTNAAVFRTGEVLQEGIEKLNRIISDAKSVKVLAHNTMLLLYITYVHSDPTCVQVCLSPRYLTRGVCGTQIWLRPSSCKTCSRILWRPSVQQKPGRRVEELMLERTIQ